MHVIRQTIIILLPSSLFSVTIQNVFNSSEKKSVLPKIVLNLYKSSKLSAVLQKCFQVNVKF